MEPQHPPFVVQTDSEEPMEVTDYYDAMQMGWLGSDNDEAVEEE